MGKMSGGATRTHTLLFLFALLEAITLGDAKLLLHGKACVVKSCCSAENAFQRCPMGVLGEASSSGPMGVNSPAPVPIDGEGTYHFIKSGTCVEAGTVAVVNTEECNKAAIALGLVNSSASVSYSPNTPRPEGCYWSTRNLCVKYERDTTTKRKKCIERALTSKLYFSANDTNTGRGAETSDGENTRSPLCKLIKPTVPTNLAKCSSGGDQRVVKGLLDCDGPADPEGTGKRGSLNGTDCPDDLSTLKFWRGGQCIKFTDKTALNRQTSRSFKEMHLTKAVVAHPHSAEKHTGLIALKRVVKLPNEEFAVFKVGYCISCPDGYQTEKYFTSKNEADATETQLKLFITDCAEKAFLNPGTQDAGIKPEYECHPWDKPKFKDFMSTF